jgi:NitT/TauT family transport system substrate-binding protein
MDWPQQRIFRYRDSGLNFYGSGLTTTRSFLRERPEAARATIVAMIRAMAWSHRNPDGAIAHLRARESLTDVAVETERQQVAFREMLVTDGVRQNGISHVQAPRLQAQLDAVRSAFNLQNMPTADQAYTDAFLPAREQRML